MPGLLIKVCGLRTQEAATAVMAAGAQWCGFIFHGPSPRHCPPEVAGGIDTGKLIRVGVFVRQSPAEIAQSMKKARLDMAQVHGTPPGEEEGEHLRRCAQMLGKEKIIKVCWPMRHPTREALEKHMAHYAPHCAAFLLDAGMDGGGSGHSIAAQTLRGLVSPRPWLLAGGLTPENAPAALASCAPQGLDFNSGLESRPGHKCPKKILKLQQLAARAS